jgi:DNA-binding MarR family transcriptional regulator
MRSDEAGPDAREPKDRASPISDAIRHGIRARAAIHAPLVVPTDASLLVRIVNSKEEGPSLLLEEASSLPQFDEKELDDPQLLSSAAAEIYRMRRARERHLPECFSGEPAWDMLLVLYSERPAKLPVSSVCYGSGVPLTTALRWIGALDEQGLVERTRHCSDGRIVLVSLTEQGSLMVERCLKAILSPSRR